MTKITSRKKSAKQLLKQTADSNMKAINEGSPGTLPVWMPPVIAGKETQVIEQVKASKAGMIDIRQNLVRIQSEVDPIGMLMAIVAGIPIPCYHIVSNEKGDSVLECTMETLDLEKRAKYAQWLGERIVPKMSANQKPVSPQEPDGAGYAALIEGAASRAEDTTEEDSDE